MPARKGAHTGRWVVAVLHVGEVLRELAQHTFNKSKAWQPIQGCSAAFCMHVPGGLLQATDLQRSIQITGY